MSVQICEGIWRNRTGQRVVITRCEPVGGQQWTDGFEYYSDDGRYYQSQREDTQDLVSFVGLLPDSLPARTDTTTAVAGGVSDDSGRIIYDLEKRLKAANATIIGQTAEIDRLKAELQRDFAAAQQLRADNESLTVRLQRAEVAAAEALQRWETTEQVCLKIITALAEVRS